MTPHALLRAAVPGKLLLVVATLALCSVTSVGGMPVAEAQVAAGSEQWVRGKTDTSLVVGVPLEGRPLHVCRAKMPDGRLHAGTAWNGTCFVAFGGKSVNSVTDETLVATNHVWVPSQGTQIPKGAVSVDGGGLFVCAALGLNKQLRPGKAWQGACYIPYGTQEIKVTENFQWLAAKLPLDVKAEIDQCRRADAACKAACDQVSGMGSRSGDARKHNECMTGPGGESGGVNDVRFHSCVNRLSACFSNIQLKILEAGRTSCPGTGMTAKLECSAKTKKDVDSMQQLASQAWPYSSSAPDFNICNGKTSCQ